jgi:hypothetical protein
VRNPHDQPEHCIAALKRTAALLVDKLATPRACSACRETIYMVPSRDDLTNKMVLKPYDISGQSHFLTCSDAARFFSAKGNKS